MTSPRIKLVCDDPSHEGRVVLVRAFPLVTIEGREDPVPLLFPDGSRDFVRGADNEPLGERKVKDLLAMEERGESVRWGYVFTCPACEHSPVSVRSDRLRVILKGMAGHGVSSLTMRGLRALLAA
ncbi:hypothetical protein [Knoellia koreensis]|uniref:Uncharacterized protein n=1 Tax=Knoellia koreensis TaxID=2730921 RepID=A0A849HFW3_9MICO|nr:hypothetical protein [Knoellia sp. DB2414S]NNM45131.1 hypothetical protein [Knoellia sp. DB2414S]